MSNFNSQSQRNSNSGYDRNNNNNYNNISEENFNQITQMSDEYVRNENNLNITQSILETRHNENLANSSNLILPINFNNFSNPNFILDHNLNSNFIKQTKFIDKNFYDILNKPILKLSQYKLNNFSYESEIHKEYFITPFGLKSSLRNSHDNLIKFGRLELDEKNEICNDIIINDSRISRFHCEINFEYGFKKIEPIKDEYVSLLMMNHHRLGGNVNVPNLDHSSLFNICKYLKMKRRFLIRDLGSNSGTYKRIRNNSEIEIRKGQLFTIGSDFILIVNEVCDFKYINSNKINILNYFISENSKDLNDSTMLIGDCQEFKEIIQTSIIDLNSKINPFLKVTIYNMEKPEINANL